MARIRSVHPEICEDDELVHVSARAERTWVRLWTHLDDAGRARDDAKLIKSRIYPLHDDMTASEVEHDLAELVAHGLLIRYAVDGVKVIATKPASWADRQRPRHPSPSKLPDRPNDYTTPTADGGNAPADTGDVAADGREAPALDVVVVGEVVVDVAPPGSGGARRDVLWDAMLAACSITGEIPDSARGAYNRARKTLADVHATPDTIAERAAVFRLRWPNVSLTPTALARRWAECEPNVAHLPGRRVSTAEAALARIENRQ